MKINHRNLAPIHCASRDSTRYNLNSIHFDEHGCTIGTNGHVLACVTPGDESKLEAFTVGLDSLESLQREQKKRNATAAELDVEATNDNGHCRITSATGALEIPKLQPGDKEFYPKWQQVLPAAECDTDRVVVISAAVLEPIIAAARQFTETKRGQLLGLRFRFTDKEMGPFAVTVEYKHSDDRLEFAAMPMRDTAKA